MVFLSFIHLTLHKAKLWKMTIILRATFLRPYYTMRCLTGVFISPRVFPFTSRFSSRFSSHFRYQHVGIQNVRKTREKSKTRAQRETMFLYYTMRWVKTRVAFWSRFGRILVAFWSRFGCVLVTNIAKTQTQRIV